MIAKHPLWLVGFRPFFILACLSGLSLPMIWALMFSGTLPMPTTTFSANQWHAHEMFFGFGWAVLGGFLLTATKNWVKIRGYHGLALIYLVAVWLVERAAVWFQGALPPTVFFVANNLFLTSIVVMLLFSLLRHREKDAYPDNYFFLVMLPAFLIAKNVLLSADHFQNGIDMTIALFRIAFLVMLERTLVPFMKGAWQVDLPRHRWLDSGIKLLGLLLVGAVFMPASLAADFGETAREKAGASFSLLAGPGYGYTFVAGVFSVTLCMLGKLSGEHTCVCGCCPRRACAANICWASMWNCTCCWAVCAVARILRAFFLVGWLIRNEFLPDTRNWWQK